MHVILSALVLVALSEMGDKTQLLAFALAARFRRPWPVMAGILVATICNHALAAAVGGWVAAQVSPRLLAGVLGVTFLAFGVWTLRPDTLEASATPSRYGPFLTTTCLFFLAEMGDKTQLATVALAAQWHQVFLVTVGTTLGMLLADGLAVLVGERLAMQVSMGWIRRIAAGLFGLCGLLALWTLL